MMMIGERKNQLVLIGQDLIMRSSTATKLRLSSFQQSRQGLRK